MGSSTSAGMDVFLMSDTISDFSDLSDEDKEDVVQEAQRRFKQAMDWEGSARNHFRDDLAFVEADAYDLRQWPDEISRPRLDASKPVLTINRTAQHVLQVVNDMRANKM